MTHIDIFPGCTKDSDIVQEWVTVHGTLEIHVHLTTKVTEKEATLAVHEVLSQFQLPLFTIHQVWEDDF